MLAEPEIALVAVVIAVSTGTSSISSSSDCSEHWYQLKWSVVVCSHNTEKVVYFLLLDRKLRNPSKDDDEDIKAKSECGE